MNKLNSTLYLVFVLLVILLTTDAALSPRIFNGHTIPITTAPFQVRLNVKNWACGGVIIGPRYVISAAHCFENKNGTFDTNRPDHYKVKAGHDNLNSVKEQDIYRIKQVVIPTPVTGINLEHAMDFAVAIVDRDFEYSERIQPAKLPDREPKAGEVVFISGWGTTERGRTNALMAVEATIGERSKCKNLMNISSKLCIKSKKDGLGACHGDSGGPAFTADGTVYGISTYSWEECKYVGNDWKGYTYSANVFYFRDFIKQVTGI